MLYQAPVLSTLLAPIIGYSATANFDVNPYSLANQPGQYSTAFTDKVTSFDGTQISVNFFPSVYVANHAAAQANTILVGPRHSHRGRHQPERRRHQWHRSRSGDSSH